jgi:uncharacterized protein YoaH (UPF0181 family)
MATDDLRALTDEQLAERLERVSELVSQTWSGESGRMVDEAARRLRQRQTTEEKVQDLCELVRQDEFAPERWVAIIGTSARFKLQRLGLWRDPVQEPSHD